MNSSWWRKLYPVAITIAGSDSGGGAGIEADLKTFAAMSVHGTVALTSITAQNTYSVTAVYDLPPEIIVKQIETVWEDTRIDAGKTGMLSNSNTIRAVASVVSKLGFPLVVDPVMIAKSGAALLKPDAVESLIKYLIPIAKVVTPNRFEAEKLTNININNIDDARAAAKYIVKELGAEAAVVKGGHIESTNDVIDIVYYNGSFYEFPGPRIPDGCRHGTGCSFSAAIAAGLARGLGVVEAIRLAKEFMYTVIKHGVKIGKGFCPVNPIAWLEIPAEKYRVIENLKQAVQIIKLNQEYFIKYIPETGMNIVMAINPKYVESINDIAGIRGRIVKYSDRELRIGDIDFGASTHLARLILAIIKYDPEIRAVMNIKYSDEIVEKARSINYKVVYVDRRNEPESIKSIEGYSMQWIVDEALKLSKGETPDIIYDKGDIGKEPMIRIFGKTAIDVVNKTLNIIKT
ncbi:MAG: bifunctional hydroxymethylpyrimidine kinase/phosphomethylpyrimidine kinase [Desulfurococcaceae archaeon]